MSQDVKTEYVEILNVICNKNLSQESFVKYFKKVKLLKKISVDDNATKEIGNLIEGILYNKISRFDHSYPLLSKFNMTDSVIINDALSKIVDEQLSYAKSGSEFISEVSKYNRDVIPWYSQEPITIPMYNYFFNLDATNYRFQRDLKNTAEKIFDQILRKKKELNRLNTQLKSIEERLNSGLYMNTVGWILCIFGVFVCFGSVMFGFTLFIIGFLMGISNQDLSLKVEKNKILKELSTNDDMTDVQELASLLDMKPEQLSQMLYTKIDSPEAAWSKINQQIIEITEKLAKYAPQISYTEEEVVELKDKRIKTIKDHLKRQLAFKSSKLLRAPAGFIGDNWQDELLTTIEPLLYQSNSQEILNIADQYRYMSKSNVSDYRIIDGNELMFSTNSVQTIYLFENKLGVLNFVYDLISDQVIHDSYEEIYYRHITSVDTQTVIIEDNFAKQFLIKTASGSNVRVNFINKEDYILQAQLKTLEGQRERLLNSAKTSNKQELDSGEDVFDEFNLEAPSVDSTAVQKSLKEIDDKIIKLKEKPFLKDIQGLDLSQNEDQASHIADNVASMVTSAIENYLGTIQVSEVSQM